MEMNEKVNKCLEFIRNDKIFSSICLKMVFITMSYLESFQGPCEKEQKKPSEIPVRIRTDHEICMSEKHWEELILSYLNHD